MRSTLTVTAEYDAPVERVWQLWADPRQLERWWGPPTYPATFEPRDVAGGRVAYSMTSPEGEKHRGWWQVVAAEPPARLAGRGRLRGRRGQPGRRPADTRMTVSIDERDGGGGVRRNPVEVPVARRDGADDCHGHGGGPQRGHGPDGRPRGGVAGYRDAASRPGGVPHGERHRGEVRQEAPATANQRNISWKPNVTSLVPQPLGDAHRAAETTAPTVKCRSRQRLQSG